MRRPRPRQHALVVSYLTALRRRLDMAGLTLKTDCAAMRNSQVEFWLYQALGLLPQPDNEADQEHLQRIRELIEKDEFAEGHA